MGTFEDSLACEVAESSGQPLCSNPEFTAQRLLRLGSRARAKELKDLLLELGKAVILGCRTQDLEVRRCELISTQSELERVGGRGVSLFDEEFEGSSATPQVQVALPESMEVSRSAKAQPHLVRAGTRLATVMDQQHSDTVLALKLAKEGEHARNFQAGILVSCDAHRYVTSASRAGVTPPNGMTCDFSASRPVT